LESSGENLGQNFVNVAKQRYRPPVVERDESQRVL
jgi:hypothetical protein